MGGTELMLNRLKASMPEGLLDDIQIIATRLNEPLDETKIRVAWIHDLANDPQLDYLKNDGWKKFHALIFVSNWQMQQFIAKFNIPWSMCVVMHNAIEPFEQTHVFKAQEPIKLIYTPTPHRGLNILIPTFVELLKVHPEITLDIFSSFKLYGWEERDKEYEKLFDFCKEHKSINYHGSQPNSVIREAVLASDIFAYPSIWPETSCLCLMEAMAAGIVCVHSNLAALYETSAGFTNMYQYQDNIDDHANLFYQIMNDVISVIKNDSLNKGLTNQSNYANQVFNWNVRKKHWKNLFTGLLRMPREMEKSNVVFKYRT
jgi:UDP-glucose:(glucosyl)LPS alpha-1,2-glucosyltransferase